MAYGTRVRFEELRQLAFGAIGAAYVACGGATGDHTRLFTIHNMTDVDLYVSLDGSTTQLRVVSGEARVLDLTANKVRDDGLFVPQGTTFWVKAVAGAPSSGAFWIEVMYADGGI
jgi:hypothetical protein